MTACACTGSTTRVKVRPRFRCRARVHEPRAEAVRGATCWPGCASTRVSSRSTSAGTAGPKARSTVGAGRGPRHRGGRSARPANSVTATSPRSGSRWAPRSSSGTRRSGDQARRRRLRERRLRGGGRGRPRPCGGCTGCWSSRTASSRRGRSGFGSATAGYNRPESPLEVVARITPTPLLIVHGDLDHYFSGPRQVAAPRVLRTCRIVDRARHAARGIGRDSRPGRPDGGMDRRNVEDEG